MKWYRFGGNWKQIKGKLREQWGHLTNDDVERIAGKRDQLLGRVQQRYGAHDSTAEKRIKLREKTLH